MPSSLPSPQPGILDIAAYKPGDSSVASGVKPIKLSSNETPLGASPKAVAAYKAAAGSLERYPDGSATALRQAIAGHYGLNADRIVCGAGSDEILNLIAHAYLGPGLEGLFCEHGFLVYKIATQAHGGTPVIAPEKNLTSDVDALLARVSERTRVVFLANPNNPTGTYIPHDEVRRLRAGLRSDILLVLDAAYAEYVRRNDYEAGLELVATTENTVMTRTFSKIYGLAGLRIGWAYGPAPVIDVLNRIRGPFNVSAPAIAAAVAALADKQHFAANLAHNDRWLGELTDGLVALGLTVTPSVGNFLLIGFGKEPGKSAADADAFLRGRGIIVRRMESYGLPTTLRLTIGTDEENRAVIAALAAFQRAEASTSKRPARVAAAKAIDAKTGKPAARSSRGK